MPQFSTQTPHKLRTVEPATARNLRELLRAEVNDVNAAALLQFKLPHHAPLTIENEHDGYGPRLRLFHRGLEIVFSLKRGTPVIARQGTLLTPMILHGIDASSVIKVSWRHARAPKVAA